MPKIDSEVGSSGGPELQRRSLGLCLLFGAFSFIQGFSEPTEGLLSQPVRSLLGGWGQTTAQIASFSALVAIPWFLKPVYGLLTDFVPVAGTRRKGYLFIGSGVAGAAFLGLVATPPRVGATTPLMVWLLIATAALAFTDVAADALMVERGQPMGLTGRLQAVQWASMYAAGIISGMLGGWLSEYRRQDLAYLLCGVGAFTAMLLAALCVDEPPHHHDRAGSREALGALWRALRSPAVLGVAAFLCLWNFNPFSAVVLHLHMTRAMGFSEQFYGNTLSLLSLASIAACIAYGFYAPRVPRQILAHASIALGVVSTLAFLAMTTRMSAAIVTLAIGFTYMTATLIQLDLAARACPTEAAGTVFATLMALSNLSMALSTWIGGDWYDRGTARWGSTVSFRILVLVGAGFTACCWFLMPILARGFAEKPSGAPVPAPSDVDDLV